MSCRIIIYPARSLFGHNKPYFVFAYLSDMTLFGHWCTILYLVISLHSKSWSDTILIWA